MQFEFTTCDACKQTIEHDPVITVKARFKDSRRSRVRDFCDLACLKRWAEENIELKDVAVEI